jgi:hypothetical protein
MYVSTEGPGGPTAAITEAATTKNLHKVRLVESADSGADSPRARKFIGVSGGDFKTFSTTWTDVETDVFTGANIHGVALFGKYYVTDGIVNKVYDPVKGTLDDWEAEGLGKVPERIKLLSSWRGRAVVVPKDEPHNVRMSKLGDPLDWDEYPEVPSFEQAISLNNPRSIGRMPDVVNTIIPYNDEIVVFGGDSTIHELIGDPAVVTLDGSIKARLSLVSDVTGIAVGQGAWTKDREGILYFAGSTGGLFRRVPNGIPERISYGSVERALTDFNLTLYRPILIWNARDEGLHLFLRPYSTQSTAPEAWFWEQKTDGWHPDSTPFQVTAATVIDGDDPDDRVLLIGTDDGRVLKWDEDSADDDGTRIQSSVLFGPHQIGTDGYEGRITCLEVTLDEDQQGCDWELYASSTPTRPDDAVDRGRLESGINIIRCRARGKWLWLRLRNGGLGERWAHEHTTVQVHRAGRTQLRA